MSYHKPGGSGGVSRCVHCGAEKVRVVPPKVDGLNKYPRTVRAGCKVNGEHRYATETVEYGWSAA